MKITIIVKHKDNRRSQLWGSSELAINARVNLRVCDEMGDTKEQVWLNRLTLIPTDTITLVSVSEECVLVTYTKINWFKKGIETESNIKCDLYITLQKWGTWKLNQLLFLETRIADLPEHNRNSLGSSLVCTVVANCARCIHKQLAVITNFSDYKKYIYFDPDFENFMINRIQHSWGIFRSMSSCVEFFAYECFDAQLSFSHYADSPAEKTII